MLVKGATCVGLLYGRSFDSPYKFPQKTFAMKCISLWVSLKISMGVYGLSIIYLHNLYNPGTSQPERGISHDIQLLNQICNSNVNTYNQYLSRYIDKQVIVNKKTFISIRGKPLNTLVYQLNI